MARRESSHLLIKYGHFTLTPLVLWICPSWLLIPWRLDRTLKFPEQNIMSCSFSLERNSFLKAVRKRTCFEHVQHLSLVLLFTSGFSHRNRVTVSHWPWNLKGTAGPNYWLKNVWLQFPKCSTNQETCVRIKSECRLGASQDKYDWNTIQSSHLGVLRWTVLLQLVFHKNNEQTRCVICCTISPRWLEHLTT